MTPWEAVLLGLVEGLTEFLPVSSTGHLTILEQLLGYTVDAPDVTAFTAIIQSGAIAATALYLRQDLIRIATSLAGGLRDPRIRSTRDYRFGRAVVLGSIPIGVVGLVFRGPIETTLRSLWVVGVALIGWSAVLWLSERVASQQRSEHSVTASDTLIIGLVQCFALIPGVSRSGATISAGLLRGLDRVTVTRLSFFLAIPALSGATVLQAVTEYDRIAGGVGWTATLIGTATSFVVGYAAVAGLLRFVARHSFMPFVAYRVALGLVVLGMVSSGVVSSP